MNATLLTYDRATQQAAGELLDALTAESPREIPAICFSCGTVRRVAESSERVVVMFCGDWKCRCDREHQVG